MDKKTLLQKTRFLLKVKENVKRLHATADRSIDKNASLATGALKLSKRLLDITVAALALFILSPLFLLVAVAIKIESRGPVFYVAKRAGRGYRIFNFIKFRTMSLDADEKIQKFLKLNLPQDVTNVQGPVFFKLNHDPRITRVGAFLRNISLDEVPQLINVLMGDMSLVGNRPLPLYEAETLTTDDYAARFMGPVGIMGLWQIKKRGKKNLPADKKISLDIDNSTKVTFNEDMWILASTPSAVIKEMSRSESI